MTVGVIGQRGRHIQHTRWQVDSKWVASGFEVGGAASVSVVGWRPYFSLPFSYFLLSTLYIDSMMEQLRYISTRAKL